MSLKPVIHDQFFLSRPSVEATKADIPAAADLLDTLASHRAECAGMAANMIGVRKNIIAVSIGPLNMLMFNPEIIRYSDPYEAEEGCLSLTGMRKTKRYRHIEVKYQDMNFHERRQSFTGYTAEIIQHECDHLKGIVI